MAELEGRSLDIVKEGKNHAHVAIPTADGSVQTVIAWAHADEHGNITVNSAEGRAWPANLRRAGKATVTLMADGNPYEWVSIQTSLAGETHEGAGEHLDELAKKYIDADEYPWSQPGEQRILFTLKPERVNYVNQG